MQLELLCTLKFDDDIHENLGRLPPKLEELYAAVYAELTSHHGKSGRSVIENTIKWLLSARRTLNASEVLWAIALNLKTPVEMESVLALCHNLVIYDEGLDIFRFAHLSVREFLEKRSEFSEKACNALAAENCLTHMIASSKSSNATFKLWNNHIRTVHERLLSVESSAGEGFMEYSFDFWMVHCGLASRDARLGDSSFGQIFRFFLSEIPMRDSAYDEWVQRYSNTLPNLRFSKKQVPESWWILHGLFHRYPNTALRIFFVAVAYGFSEVTEPYLQNGRLGEKELNQAVLLAAKAGHQEVFGLLMNTKNLELTSEVLLSLIESRNKETLEGLRSKLPSSCFTEQTCLTVIGIKDEWYLDWLLEQYPHLTVTEQMLTHAIKFGTTYAFELLLVRTASSMPLDEALMDAIRQDALAEIRLILARAGSSSLNSALMARAACRCKHIATMEVLLRHGGASMISEDVLVNAAGDHSGEMLKLILVHGGKITQNVLLENAWRVSAEVLDMLLQHNCEINSGVLEACVDSHPSYIGSFDALLSRVEDSIIAPEIAHLLYKLAKKRWLGPATSGDKSKMIRQLLDRSDKLSIDQDTIRLLRAVADSGRGGADLMERLLDRTDKTAIAAEMTTLLMVLAYSIYSSDDVEMMRLLLDCAESSAITEDVFLAAVSNGRRDHLLPMILERANTTAITEDVLGQALQHLCSDVIWKVLARVEPIDITGDLLAAAAANMFCGDAIVRKFLQEADLTELPFEVVKSAMMNVWKGEEIMVALEQSFGPIELTEPTLLSLLDTRNYLPLLPGRLKPEHITGKVLIAAMPLRDDETFRAITERSSHVPITLDVLEAAIRSRNLDYFRFFWNRAHLNDVPQRLIKAAAENDFRLFKSLLADAEEVRSEEGLLMAIARYQESSIEMLELLLKRDIPLKITSNVIRAAVVAWTTIHSRFWSIENSPIPWLLNRSPNLEVTDELFRMAAAAGRRGILDSLARHRGMEDLPDEWTNVAKLRNAAMDGDDTTVENLVNGGVDPNVADVDGWTPLWVAAKYGHEQIIRMLLSAGVKPNQVANRSGSTPFHLAAMEGQYKIVELLVEAGASIEARDDDGRTPAMVAKQYHETKTWLYLRRCKKNREERKQEKPGAA